MSTASYRDTWAETVVRTVSPNGQVFVDNHGDQRIEVRMDDGYFHRSSSDQVAEQVVRALRLAVAERFQAYRKMLRQATGLSFEEPVRGRRRHADEARRRAAELAVEGSSADGTVEVTSIGLQHIALRIDPQLFSAGDRLRLEANLSEACTRAVQAQYAGMRKLKHEVVNEGH